MPQNFDYPSALDLQAFPTHMLEVEVERRRKEEAEELALLEKSREVTVRCDRCLGSGRVDYHNGYLIEGDVQCMECNGIGSRTAYRT